MEKISDENLQRGIDTFSWGCETTIGATQAGYLYNALCELQELREADNKPVDEFAKLSASLKEIGEAMIIDFDDTISRTQKNGCVMIDDKWTESKYAIKGYIEGLRQVQKYTKRTLCNVGGIVREKRIVMSICDKALEGDE